MITPHWLGTDRSIGPVRGAVGGVQAVSDFLSWLPILPSLRARTSANTDCSRGSVCIFSLNRSASSARTIIQRSCGDRFVASELATMSKCSEAIQPGPPASC